MEEIKRVVTEKEMERIDKVLEEIYDTEPPDEYSTAYILGFDTVVDLNGSGYENLVRIVDSLNEGGEEEYFARFILDQVLDNHKIEILKKELKKNKNDYIRLWDLKKIKSI